ncbi:MAG: metal-dependent transcriptional regulator [bacterium]
MKNQEETWKLFEQNPLTHSAAHYLITIHELLQEQGYARLTDIAKKLDITRGSASISIKTLKKKNLIIEDHNKFLKLSAEGKKLATSIEKNDQLLVAFFKEILLVKPEQAEIDACKIEHLLSPETAAKLQQFVQLITGNNPLAKKFLSTVHKQHLPAKKPASKS